MLFFRLKFVVGTSGVNLFISSDMFYLEILVESSGSVKDVKIHHEGKVSIDKLYIKLIVCKERHLLANFIHCKELHLGLVCNFSLYIRLSSKVAKSWCSVYHVETSPTSQHNWKD